MSTDGDASLVDPVPGDDLTAMSDEQLRVVIRRDGWDSPWYGSSDERTPEMEVLTRYPYLCGLRRAVQVAFTADTNAAWESDPDIVTSWLSEPSAVTAAVHDAYLHALQRWLDGTAIDQADPR
ncbi:hypothetical protein [Nocardia sp. NRRL S-836]|uniref:hypothetical protein n=1 Tax=Nocardia sp. NRRL S-836 TaxID=1519492 RepID=UPI0006AF2012|nr:hypothetical protein [Nocardia sp. NRRL S-836]